MIQEELKKDCKFFEDNKIIDYSLLIGVHNNSQNRLDSMNIDESSIEFMSLRNSRLNVIIIFYY